MSPETKPSNGGADSAHLIAIKGRLDRALDNVDKALASGINLVLDFHECTFITVDGLEWLEELLLRAESLGSTVRFQHVPNTQYKVFKVAHIQSLLKACGSPPAGIAPVC
jgi:hypothetical protein